METRLGLYEKAMPSGLSFQNMLSATRDAGFDFMEISIDESDMRQSRLSWSNQDKAILHAAIRDSGVPISSMCLSGHRKYPLGSHDASTREQGLAMFKKAVAFSEEFGIKLIQLAGYDVYYEQGDKNTRSWFAENLAKCVEIAAAHSTALGFETMETPFMDTVSKSMAYVSQINSPYLGVYPDLGNLTNACRIYGTSVIDELESGRGHLLAMHIKETEEGKYRDMRFGTGKVDFVPGIRKAYDLGVRQFVSECWHDGCADWHRSIADVHSFVKGKMDEAEREEMQCLRN